MLSKREVRLFGRYECELIKTPSIHLYTLVKSKRASSHPTGAAQSSLSKFDAGNAIDDFHAGLLLQYVCCYR
ncbi:MAG: hypothetical protein EKE20_05315 [Candidatus Symbiopectobacterium sp. Dall1.0]|nr:hypothetical protein [Candidatus Symbiopectobacterium sp. Dall1.0]MBG6247775.1 hypothetical protein [Candidatus Symbiopectobacterium sp. PLON1]